MPAASHSAWTVPSSPYGPWSARNATGRGVARTERIDRRARATRATRAERRRVVVRGARPSVPAMVGGQRPPASVEVDQELLDGIAGADQRLRDRGARHDRDVVLCRRPAEDDGDRRRGGLVAERRDGHQPRSARRPASVQPAQSPRNTISNCRRIPRARLDHRPHVLSEPSDVGGRALPVVHDEVRVLLGHRRRRRCACP